MDLPRFALLAFLLAQVQPAEPDAGVRPDEPVPQPARAVEAGAEGGGASRLQGLAYLDRRRRVVGAAVTVTPEKDPARVWMTTTDGKGAFRLNGVPDGTYRVEIRRDGLRPVVKSDVSLRFPFRAIVEVAMQEGAIEAAGERALPAVGTGAGSATIAGQVIDPEGRPLREVQVRLVAGDARADPRSVRTGDDGGFSLADLSPGSWSVSVLGLGYLPIRSDLEVGGGLELTAVLVPQPADYEPSPIDLLPQERPIPPQALSRPPAAPVEAPRDPEPPAGDDGG